MKKVALVLVGVFAIIFLFFVVEHFRGKLGLARWKARMAAKGEALTIGAGIAPLPPANENGMGALNVAAGQIGIFPSKILPPLGTYAVTGKMIVVTRLGSWLSQEKKSTNVTWEILGDVVKPREAALKSALEALAYPEFNANPDCYRGWGTLLPHLSRARHLQWTLKAAALHRLRCGRFDEAIEFMEGVIQLPGVLRDEAFTISHLVRITMAREAFQATWQATHVEGLSDTHLRELQEAWAALDFLRPMRRALVMEHVVVSYECGRMRNSDVGHLVWAGLASPRRPSTMTRSPIDALAEAISTTPDFIRDQIYSPVWKFAWSYQDELRYLKTVEHGLNAWDAAIAERSAGPLRALGNAEHRYLMDTSDPIEPTTFRFMLSPRAERFFPAMHKAFVAQTWREMAIAGLALRRYELRYGKPAASLESLVPEFLPAVPRDFMDGTPLKYHPTNAVMRLYSVDVDLRNDAGEFKNLVWPEAASDEEMEKFYRMR